VQPTEEEIDFIC
jgi:glycerol-3-phosphate dehydrogenase